MISQMKCEDTIFLFTPSMEQKLVDSPLNCGSIDQGHNKAKYMSHTLTRKNYKICDAIVANFDLSPFLKVTWPAIGWCLNFSTAYVKPFDVSFV